MKPLYKLVFSAIILIFLAFPFFAFAQTLGDDSSTDEISIGPDLPTYITKGNNITHSKYFAGSTYSIIAPNPFKIYKGELVDKKDSKNRVVLPEKKRRTDKDVVIEIPSNTEPGEYIISVILDSKIYTKDIIISTNDSPSNTSKVKSEAFKLLTSSDGGYSRDSAVNYYGKISDRFWELAFTGDPNNSNNLAMSPFSRSVDGGRTWNNLPNDYRAEQYFKNKVMPLGYGDPKLVGLNDGTFVELGLAIVWVRNDRNEILGAWTTGASGRADYKDNLIDDTFVQPVPTQFFSDKTDGGLIFDRPFLAKDPKTDKIYISSFGTDITKQNYNLGTYLYVSDDKGQKYQKYLLGDKIPGLSTIPRPAVTQEGTLFMLDYKGITKVTSLEPFTFERYTNLPNISQKNVFPRLSTNSNRGFLVYLGPELVVDNGEISPHKGRLFMTWSEPEKIIEDSNFEYGEYGHNFDVFVSFSDDNGKTWSSPANVSDENEKGDQYFASAMVDPNGVFHISFVDHRFNQDQSQLDVFYTKSLDGIHFSKNIRVNQEPIGVSKYQFGRPLGDYLDMIMAYSDKVYIAHPCGRDLETGPTHACLAEVDPNKVPFTTPSPSPSPSGGTGVYTVSYKIAESPTELATASAKLYDKEPLDFDYVFKDPTPGAKFLFVEFKDSVGGLATRSAQIDLVAPSASPSPSPSTSPSPSPSASPVVPPPPPAGGGGGGGGGSGGGGGGGGGGSGGGGGGSGGSQQASRRIADFRYAEDPTALQRVEWKTYGQGIIVEYEFENSDPGEKFIFVQFRDQYKMIVKINGAEYATSSITLETDSPPSQGGTNPDPAPVGNTPEVIIGNISLSTTPSVSGSSGNWAAVSINLSLSGFSSPGRSIAGLFVRNQTGECSINDCGYDGWTQIRSYGTNGTDTNSWTASGDLSAGVHMFAAFSLNADGTAGQLLAVSKTNFGSSSTTTTTGGTSNGANTPNTSCIPLTQNPDNATSCSCTNSDSSASDFSGKCYTGTGQSNGTGGCNGGWCNGGKCQTCSP